MDREGGHYKTFFDNKYVGAWDLDSKHDAICIIESCGGETLKTGDKEDRKIVIRFVGKTKPFVCNKTNAKTIAKMYGPRTSEWRGKAIALYPTTTQAFGETHECIRVRPTIPTKPRGKAPPKTEAPALPAAPHIHDAEFENVPDSQEIAS